MHLSQPATTSLPFLCRSCVACFTALPQLTPHDVNPISDFRVTIENGPAALPPEESFGLFHVSENFHQPLSAQRILVVGAALGQKAKIRAASATPLRRRAGREGQPCLITRTRRKKKPHRRKKTSSPDDNAVGSCCWWNLRGLRDLETAFAYFLLSCMIEPFSLFLSLSLSPHALLRNRRMQML